MEKTTIEFLKSIDSLQEYLNQARKSIERGEFISPQGYLYAISNDSLELVRELKKVSPNL